MENSVTKKVLIRSFLLISDILQKYEIVVNSG